MGADSKLLQMSLLLILVPYFIYVIYINGKTLSSASSIVRNPRTASSTPSSPFLVRELNASNLLLNICHISDVHGSLESLSRDGDCPSTGFPISNSMKYSSSLDKYCSDGLRFFTGDMMAGSEYDRLKNGSLSLWGAQLMRLWKLSSWTTGNHEWDRGWKDIGKLISPEIPIIQTDFLLNKQKFKSERWNWEAKLFEKVVTPSVIFKDSKSGVTVCVFGTGLNDLNRLGRPPIGYFTVKSDADQLKSALRAHAEECLTPAEAESLFGVRTFGNFAAITSIPPVRILLSHMGFDRDQEILKILDSSLPFSGFHVVLGGHSHRVLSPYPGTCGSSALWSHTGSSGEYLGFIQLQYSKALNQWMRTSSSQLVKLSEVQPEDAMQFLDWCQKDALHLSKYRNAILAEISAARNISVATLPLDGMKAYNSRACRNGPCLMAKAVADSMRLETLHWLKEGRNSAAAKSTEKACEASKAGDVSRFKMLLDDNVKVVSGELAGNLQKEWPTGCKSVFERRLGCDDPRRLSGYDIEATLPYRNPLQATLLKESNLCDILRRSLERLKKQKGRSPALISCNRGKKLKQEFSKVQV